MPIQRYFVAIVLTMSGVAIAQPPTSTSLIEAVPRLFNGAEDLRSFSLRCECGTKDGIPVVFDIAWKAPNEYSLLIRDVESSTPVAFFSNDGFLIYDVSRHSLIAGNGIRPSFELFSHEHSKLKLNFSLSRVEKDETSAEFDVNLTSFLRDLDGETDIST